MKTFLVGGAVRDMLMGLEPKDKDYVVVGGDDDYMLSHGYTRVGADFPVYLDKTGEEFALARKEKSTGNGYNDFEVSFGPDVTLEEDLFRRDLTVNAMAKGDNGLFDPFGGQRDLQAKTLRHVSGAFEEDPVRVLRVARFMARFGPEWTVAEETENLMWGMAKAGMLNDLTGERVWKELSRALVEPHPRLFFDTLDSVGALETVFPVLHKMKSVPENVKWHPEGNTFEHTMLVLEQARKLTDDPKVMFAALTHDFGKTLTDPNNWPSHHDHENLGVSLVSDFAIEVTAPSSFKKTAMSVCKNHMKMKHLDDMKAKSFVRMFNKMGAMNNPDLVDDLVTVAKADARGKLGFHDVDVDHLDTLKDKFDAFRNVKFWDAVKEAGLDEAPTGEQAGQVLHKARLKAVAKA